MSKNASLRIILTSCLVLVPFVPAFSADEIGMVTGSKSGTYIQFGRDIASVATSEELDILVKESGGSLDNIRRLVSVENAALGIVQSDVLGFLSRSDLPGNKKTAKRLRLVFPFYNEEVHLFARRGITRFEDLEGKRVAVGAEGSGNWVTSTNLLGMLNVNPAERLRLRPETALKAVLSGKIDAMFYVAGKPVKLFQVLDKMKTNSALMHLVEEVHFVPLDHSQMLAEYVTGEIGSDDYSWVSGSVATIAVKAVLVSFDFSSMHTPYYRDRCEQLGRLGRVIRSRLEELKTRGHKKWRSVDLEQAVGIWQQDSCSRGELEDPTDTGETDIEKHLDTFFKRELQ